MSIDLGQRSKGARVLCINPCPTDVVFPPVALDGLTVPGLGTKIKPVMTFELKGSCDSCEVAAQFLLQIQPFLISLSLPMCILKCLLALIGKEQDPPSFLGLLTDIISGLPAAPEPDVLTDFTDSFTYAVDTCVECFTGWSPTKFCCLVRDIIDIFVAVLKCIISLFEKLLTLSLRMTGMMMDPEITIRKTAECLDGLILSQREQLCIKLDLIGTAFKAINFLIEFAPIPGVDLTAIDVSFSSIGKHTPIPVVLEKLNQLVCIFGVKDSPTCPGIRSLANACCA